MSKFTRIICMVLSLLQVLPAAAATDLALSPLPFDITNQAPPNIIFGLDDSGSMDFEVLLPTNDGAAWWDGNTKSFVSKGVFNFNATGDTGAVGSYVWYKYAYLFPNGSTSGNRNLTDGANSHLALPPIDAYGWARSADYNPVYYDHTVTYLPWEPAYTTTALTFPAATPTAVKSHPILGGAVISVVGTLAANTGSNATFRFLPGMVIPGATVAGVKVKKTSASTYTALSADYTVKAGEAWDVAMPYTPAMYYVKDAACSSGCAVAPDGAKLRKVVIAAGNTFPSGRSYAAELQNFANWFQYYRKRKLMLAAAMGTTLSQLGGVRAGVVAFNNQAAVTMYDFDSTDQTKNARRLLGVIYSNAASGGTPTRETLNYIGKQFMNNSSVVQYACQANSTFILTDGFAYANSTNPGTYANTWVKGAPYQSIFAGTLADIAGYFYTTNLRSAFATGKVPVDLTNPSRAADKNPNLHMNTYALTLGARGTIYGVDDASTRDPYANPPVWPNPVDDRSPTAVDDLWHATIVGRGMMFVADSVSNLVDYLKQSLAAMIASAGSHAGLSVSSQSLKAAGNYAYMAGFNAREWTGDVLAYSMEGVSAGFDTKAPVWTAAAKLTARSPDGRIIVTMDDDRGAPFQSSLSAGYRALLDTAGKSDSAEVVQYIRGDRSLEGNPYRVRKGLFGDAVHAKPAYSGAPVAGYGDIGYADFVTAQKARVPVVLQGANDGMLHVLDAQNGDELWAYIPGALKSKLNAYTSTSYSHRYYVDATPAIGHAAFADGSWHTLAIGGYGGGGKGYYALDITTPTAASEVAAASKVMWEFPSATRDTAATIAGVGYSYGQPLLVKTKALGWVVLVSSGYNNQDGRGHLFALRPDTGEVLADIPTPAPSGTGQIGLAHLSAFAANGVKDATTDYVYGGDLQGNVWRFDLSGADVSTWAVTKLAALADAAGTAQPVTAPLELAVVKGNRMVYAVTGKLLEAADSSNNQTQTVYALKDNLSATPLITPLRSKLTKRSAVVGVDEGRTIPYAEQPATAMGWYFDLPTAGERGISAISAAYGLLNFTTIDPAADACAGGSYFYSVSLETGTQAPDSSYDVGPAWAGVKLGSTLANEAVIVSTPGAGARGLIGKADRTVSNIKLPGVAKGGFRKVGWQEIYR